jgi:asparagine synthase (glutamine-hydrolysing)
MCGLAGFLDTSLKNTNDQKSRITLMTNMITHRGPDDSGAWVDPQVGIALGHRRLAVLDLSPNGHQPMKSTSGRYVIVFNGEIYNHLELRKELEDSKSPQLSNSRAESFDSWRGHSDTEVMLEAFEQWGVEGALSRFNGMFAFALWDVNAQMLHLARDRFGEKPLYYGWMDNVFLFGSELKALKAHPAWRGEIDRGALALYMRHTYVPAPYSIYRGIRKLLPAHVLSIPLSVTTSRKLPQPCAYWSAKSIAENGVRHQFGGTELELVDALDVLLHDAVRLRMESDVPLGAFLSGGIDSSTVVALMQNQSSRPVKTFTIGFHENGYNEAKHAQAVAKHLGTEHTELYVSATDAIGVIPQLPHIFDEPFSDSSQIPTFLVSKMTRQHVTVALSGDGGDELFGGYNRYFWGRDIWNNVGWMPTVVRGVIARGLMTVSPKTWNTLFDGITPMLPHRLRATLSGDKLHKLAGVLRCSSSEIMYKGLVTFWEPESVVLDAHEPPTALTNQSQQADIPDLIQRMMFLDQVSYLPDDILTKVDRASMAVSLESRVPLLDHRVAEFAWSLPLDMNIRNGKGKWPLRQVLHRYVPDELVERPKMGFGVPIDDWLRGPLREWAESLLDDARLKQEGFLNYSVVREKWNEHLSGSRNWSSQLWTVLMFQAWLESQCS